MNELASNSTDIRWKQRFANYKKALRKLHLAIEIIKASAGTDVDNDIDDLQQEGLIQRFEYTHQLAWNVMKDYAQYQGSVDIGGSRDAIRTALQMGLIENGADWMSTIESRNITSHAYDEDKVDQISDLIIYTYLSLFDAFEQKMEALVNRED